MRPKPAPDIYERSGERLAVALTQVLVLEGTREGVRAALAAGQSVIQLR